MQILLVGCGKMGGAMLSKWIEKDMAEVVSVINPSSLKDKFGAVPFAQSPKVFHYSTVDAFLRGDILFQPDVVVLGVKPQIADDVCAKLAEILPAQIPVLSIMTGKTIQTLEKYFPTNPIIRTMPNTPAQIGKGVTVGVANGKATRDHIAMATDLLSANGKVHWIDNENRINVVAAISGSGPAYLDLFAQMLAEVGIENGLPKTLANDLARHTLIGAGAMAEANPEKTLEDLRLQVTSPGGSTAKAIESYMQGESLLNVTRKAVKAAIKRNIELGK